MNMVTLTSVIFFFFITGANAGLSVLVTRNDAVTPLNGEFLALWSTLDATYDHLRITNATGHAEFPNLISRCYEVGLCTYNGNPWATSVDMNTNSRAHLVMCDDANASCWGRRILPVPTWDPHSPCLLAQRPLYQGEFWVQITIDDKIPHPFPTVSVEITGRVQMRQSTNTNGTIRFRLWPGDYIWSIWSAKWIVPPGRNFGAFSIVGEPCPPSRLTINLWSN